MKNIEELAAEWVGRDATDPYSGGYVGTLIDGLLNRISMMREALRDVPTPTHYDSNWQCCGSHGWQHTETCWYDRGRKLAYPKPEGMD